MPPLLFQLPQQLKMWNLCCISLCILFGSALGELHLAGVVVPPHKMFGDYARLDCPFDLNGKRLYTVKWYKDNEELYRYVPRFKPAIRTHNVDGIKVLMEESDQKFVTLGPLNLGYSGMYKCEVNTEGPAFESVEGEGRMTVVHLPKEGPQISGKMRQEYETGEQLALNCTSAKSFPPARLSWFINDIPIEDGVVQVKPRHRISPERLREEESESRMNITLSPEHFNPNGEARVRCVASISTLFWQLGDERLLENTRKTPQTDFRNNFNSVASSQVFQHDQEASFLVRGGSPSAFQSTSVLSLIFGVFLTLVLSPHSITCTSTPSFMVYR